MTERWQQILWGVAQLIAGFVMYGAFFVFAPWLAAKPVADATADALSSLPKGCPAFSVNHGAYICEWQGTVAQNPSGFALCIGILVAAGGFFVVSSMMGRGLAALEWPSWLRRSRHGG